MAVGVDERRGERHGHERERAAGHEQPPAAAGLAPGAPQDEREDDGDRRQQREAAGVDEDAGRTERAEAEHDGHPRPSRSAARPSAIAAVVTAVSAISGLMTPDRNVTIGSSATAPVPTVCTKRRRRPNTRP